MRFYRGPVALGPGTHLWDAPGFEASPMRRAASSPTAFRDVGILAERPAALQRIARIHEAAHAVCARVTGLYVDEVDARIGRSKTSWRVPDSFIGKFGLLVSLAAGRAAEMAFGADDDLDSHCSADDELMARRARELSVENAELIVERAHTCAAKIIDRHRGDVEYIANALARCGDRFNEEEIQKLLRHVKKEDRISFRTKPDRDDDDVRHRSDGFLIPPRRSGQLRVLHVDGGRVVELPGPEHQWCAYGGHDGYQLIGIFADRSAAAAALRAA